MPAADIFLGKGVYCDSIPVGFVLLAIRYIPNKPNNPWITNRYIKKPLDPIRDIIFDTKIGPKIDPNPIKILKVDDADTISLVSKKSFTCATAKENIGRHIHENNPAKIKNAKNDI